MTIIIIDTSTDKSQVILAQSFDNFEVIRAEPDRLPQLLKERDPDPSIIAVTSGPGSYTGIRVGKALAKGLSAPKGLKIKELCSLSGFAPPRDGRYLSLIDARGGGAYTLLQERQGDTITPLGPVAKTPLEELPTLLHACDGIIGPSLSRFSLLKCEETYADPLTLLSSL